MKDMKFFLKRLVFALLSIGFFALAVMFALDFYYATSLVKLFKYLILSMWFLLSTASSIDLYTSVTK